MTNQFQARIAALIEATVLMTELSAIALADLDA